MARATRAQAAAAAVAPQGALAGQGRGRAQAAPAGRGRGGRGVVAGPFPYLGLGLGQAHPPEPEDEPPPAIPPELPPAPAVNPLITEVGMVLMNLGFPGPVRQRFTNEGITLLSHFLNLQEGGIDMLFREMRTEGIHATLIQSGFVHSIHHYVRRMFAISMPINPINITAELLAIENQNAAESKPSPTTSKSNLTFPPPFKDHSKWRTFKDLFLNYLHSIKGPRNVPLAYVIRPDIVPLGIDPLDPMYRIELHGSQYMQDRSEVYTILERCVIQGPGETYVKEFQSTRNGRMAFLELDRRFGGDAVTSTKIGNAWKTIHTTKYNGRRKNFDFTTYKSVLDEAFRDLQESGLTQPDATKVYFLLNGIESDQLKRVKDGVVTNPLMCNNYHEATLYIARCIAHDNSVDTDSKMARSIMASSGVGISTRNYTDDEWKKLSPEEKHTIQQLRWQKSPTGGTRGGRSSYTGRGRSTNNGRAPGRGFTRGGRFPGRGRGRDRSGGSQYANRWSTINVDGKTQSPSTAVTTFKRQVSQVETDPGYYGDYYGPFPPENNESYGYDASDANTGVIEPRTTGKSVPFPPSSKTRRISAMRVRHISYSRSVDEEEGRCELDSHADNCLLGKDAVVLEEHVGEKFQLYGYKRESGFSVVHTVRGALAYDLGSGETLILIFDQAFYDPSLPNSLVNPNQMRENGVEVHDTPLRYGGESHAIKVAGLTMRLKSKGCVSYLPVRKPTEEEILHCTQINMTGSVWDPHSEEFQEVEDSLIDSRDIAVLSSKINAIEPETLAQKLMISRELAEKTLKATTIYAVREFNEGRYTSYGHRFRWLGRRRITGRFWTDTFFGQKSASGNTCAQIFINEFRFIFCVPMKGRGEAPYALRSFFSNIGLPDLLISDNAREQRSEEWKQVLREFGVLERPVEAYKSWKNYAENGVFSVKFKIAKLMEQRGVPGTLWDHTLMYVALVSDRSVTNNPRLEGRTPHEFIFGETPDISSLISFSFYEHVWYYNPTNRFPDLRRLVGRWLGPSKTLSTDLIYKILTINGNVIHTASVEPITKSDRDQSGVTHLIKEFDISVHKLLPFVSIDIKDLFDIDASDNTKVDIEYINDVVHPYDIVDITDSTVRNKRSADEAVAEIATQKKSKVAEIARFTIAEIATTNNTPTDISKCAANMAGEDDWDLAEIARKYTTDTPVCTAEADIAAATRIPSIDVDFITEADVAEGFRGWESANVCMTGRKGKVSHKLRDRSSTSSNPLFDDTLYQINYDDGTTDELFGNAIASSIYDSIDNDGFSWLQLDEILDHFQPNDETQKDGWHFLIRWKDGSDDVVDLRQIKESYPVKVAEYAINQKLNHYPAFRYWVHHTMRKRERIIKKIRTKNVRRTEKFGISIPRSVREALQLDELSGTSYWGQAIDKEMKNVQIAFNILPKGQRAPPGYQFITCHMIFDVKLDGTRKARYVAGGHLTDTPSSITYSTMVSRDSIRVLLVIAALNGLDVLSCDIQNAYLNAKPREKVFFTAGEEFGESRGQVVIVVRALYGLKSSGAAFRAKLAQDLREMGYKSSLADPDVWMRARGKQNGETYWEYVLVYVDDILCISHLPKEFMMNFSRVYTLKDGFASPKSFLGVNLSTYSVQDYRGKESICWGFECEEYIKRVLLDLESQVKLPTTAMSPMRKDYKPELDVTALLNEEGITKYQELVGSLRWLVEIGRIDISHSVSVLSSYLACPRLGHLLELFHVFAYLKRNLSQSLILNPQDLKTKGFKSVSRDTHTWDDFYPDALDPTPDNIPEPRGLGVDITCFVDSDHAGDLCNRRSHSGVIIYLQSAPVIWFSKKQNTIETSTHGAELVSTRIAVELIEGLRYKLRMFGVPLHGPATVFCDNESVVHNTTRPDSVLKKKHNSISYHKIRESVAAGIIEVFKIPSSENTADLLTKTLSGVQTTYHTSNILFHDTQLRY